jgi:hypothetical protein
MRSLSWSHQVYRPVGLASLLICRFAGPTGTCCPACFAPGVSKYACWPQSSTQPSLLHKKPVVSCSSDDKQTNKLSLTSVTPSKHRVSYVSNVVHWK